MEITTIKSLDKLIFELSRRRRSILDKYKISELNNEAVAVTNN